MEEKALFGKNVVYLSFITAQEYEQLENPQPSTSHCFPIKDGKVLFTVNPRGVDIIGGHIEKGETGDEALMREAMEEGCIIPTQYKLVGAIRVDNRESQEFALSHGYPLVGYQLIYLVSEFEEKEFNVTHECVARQYLEIEDIKEKHHAWLGVHQKALSECFSQLSQARKNKLKQ